MGDANCQSVAKSTIGVCVIARASAQVLNVPNGGFEMLPKRKVKAPGRFPVAPKVSYQEAGDVLQKVIA